MQAFDVFSSQSHNHSRKITTTHQKKKSKKTPPSTLAHKTGCPPKKLIYIPPPKKSHHIHQEGEQLLRVTVPVKVTGPLGFRLEKFLIYEVTKGGWAEAVGLKLGTLAIHKTGGKGLKNENWGIGYGWFTWNPGVVVFCCLGFIQRLWCEKSACGNFF